jgi:hypothetical protein
MAIEFVPDDEVPQQVQPAGPTEETFDSYAATMPETASGFLDDVATPSPTVQGVDGGDGATFLDDSANVVTETPSPRKRKSLKKLQKSLDRFQQRLSKWPIAYFANKAKDHPEWALDDDEKELISDSIETVFEVLDVGVDIQPIEYTITSVYWILLYPFAAFFALFMLKKAKSIEVEQQQEQQK